METDEPRSTPAKRFDPWRLLENPLVWEATRFGLDIAFGLYRKRLAMLGEFGVLGPKSLLDVGCGIGNYARADVSRYVGIDLDDRYIAYARKRRGSDVHEFRHADVAAVAEETGQFDTVLAVDLLHHLPDEAALRLLRECSRVATERIVLFEPVIEQHNGLGRWIIDHDRGAYMRSFEALRTLLSTAPIRIQRNEELRLGPISTRAILATPTTGSHG